MITGTEAEYQSDVGYTKETPYLALAGELWDVFCEYLWEIDHIITAPHSIKWPEVRRVHPMNCPHIIGTWLCLAVVRLRSNLPLSFRVTVIGTRAIIAPVPMKQSCRIWVNILQQVTLNLKHKHNKTQHIQTVYMFYEICNISTSETLYTL